MRDYQTKQNKGALPDSITSEKFGAGEFNSIAQELENAVSRSGQTLAPADGTGEVLTQLAESEFIHGVKSQSFQDGGTANTYQLTPISGASGVKIPADYTNLDGAVVTFTPGNASTGASTLDIGQTLGTLLGPKTLLKSDGSAIGSGDIGTDQVEIRYDASADGGSGAWLLQPWAEVEAIQGNLTNVAYFTTSGSWVVPADVTEARFVVYGAGGGGGGGDANASGSSSPGSSGGNSIVSYATSSITLTANGGAGGQDVGGTSTPTVPPPGQATGSVVGSVSSSIISDGSGSQGGAGGTGQGPSNPGGTGGVGGNGALVVADFSVTPSDSVTITIGAGGAGGAGNGSPTASNDGSDGADGFVIVEW